jgi:predicted nucleic acid-binding Zn ribbon protein
MGAKITPISDIVKNVFLKLENEKTFSKEDVEASWKEIAGEAGFKHSRPMTLRGGVLTVCVDSSVWMQEMNMQKRRILKRLKSAFGKDRISELHFKIGEF